MSDYFEGFKSLIDKELPLSSIRFQIFYLAYLKLLNFSDKNKLYLIDFGLAKRFIDRESHLHIVPRKIRKGLTGTAR